MDRREFLKGAGTAALVSAGVPAWLSHNAWAAKMPGLYSYTPFSNELHLPSVKSLEEVASMTPMQIARSSALITGAYEELHQVASSR